jgi:hypothetical protein
MVSTEKNKNLLREWEAIMRRIESIDARLWQGAGILLVISIGGISLLGWNTPQTLADFVIVVIASLVSLAILFVWWFIFHRWIYLQGLYSYRAREIEDSLDLRFNIYARLLEHWASPSIIGSDKNKLKVRDGKAYDRLEDFWKKQREKHFVHKTIRTALRWLTFVLAGSWFIFIIFYTIAYFHPHFLGLNCN